jgi:hypothetical protein
MASHLHLFRSPALAITATAAVPGTGGRARSASPGPRAVSWSSERLRRRPGVAVMAAAGGGEQKQQQPGGGQMRLNEYMVTVDQPLGVRFALGVDGRVFVHSLRKGVSAANGRPTVSSLDWEDPRVTLRDGVICGRGMQRSRGSSWSATR